MCFRYGSLCELIDICILLKDVAKAMSIRQKGNPNIEQLVKDLEALQQASKSVLGQYSTKSVLGLSWEAEGLVFRAMEISGDYYLQLTQFLEQMRAQRRYLEMETHIYGAKLPSRCCYCRLVSWITLYRSRASRQEMKEDNKLYEQIVARKPGLEKMLEIWSL